MGLVAGLISCLWREIWDLRAKDTQSELFAGS